MDNRDEIRTALEVARRGTVSGAAETLGVHHATVIRRVDTLEKRLGARLFQRHARGYTPTETGRDLLAVAEATQEQFAQLANRIRGQGETVTGELLVTSVAGMSRLLVPVMTAFQGAHPGLILRYLTDVRAFRLDFGEAHVAIRAGAVPSEPDNVVQPLARLRSGLYASRSYVAAMGRPESPDDFAAHRFLIADDPSSRAPFYQWLRDKAPPSSLTFRASEPAALAASDRVVPPAFMRATLTRIAVAASALGLLPLNRAALRLAAAKAMTCTSLVPARVPARTAAPGGPRPAP